MTASPQTPSWAIRFRASGSPTPSLGEQGLIWRSERRHQLEWRCQNLAPELPAGQIIRLEAMALFRSTNKCRRIERTGKPMVLRCEEHLERGGILSASRLRVLLGFSRALEVLSREAGEMIICSGMYPTRRAANRFCHAGNKGLGRSHLLRGYPCRRFPPQIFSFSPMFVLLPDCSCSGLAQTRPSSTEQVHGFAATNALVSTLGRPPEEEDAAIGKEWSPRGGRRLQNIQTSTSPSLSGAGGGRRWFQGRCLSRSPPGRRAHAERFSRLPNSSSSTSPSPRRKASSCSPTRRGRGQGRRRRLQAGGRGGRGRRGEKRLSTPLDDSDKSISFGAISEDGSSANSSFAHPFDASSRWPLDMSPEPPAACGATSTTKPLGNLGGPFMRPESPYRTYRAKHYRLLRAQSSERAATLARRSKLQEKLENQWLPRSRSADGARRRRGRRHGSSGMTSPLLKREGFGLLQSSVTGKVLQGIWD